jgi:hypothetical protein
VNDVDRRRRLKDIGDALSQLSPSPERVACVAALLERYDVWIRPIYTPLVEAKYLAPDPYHPGGVLRSYFVPKTGTPGLSTLAAKKEGRLLTLEEVHNIAWAKLAVVFDGDGYREMVVMP